MSRDARYYRGTGAVEGTLRWDTAGDAATALRILRREHAERGSMHPALEAAAVLAVETYATTSWQDLDSAIEAFRRAIWGFDRPERAYDEAATMAIAAEIIAAKKARRVA